MFYFRFVDRKKYAQTNLYSIELLHNLKCLCWLRLPLCANDCLSDREKRKGSIIRELIELEIYLLFRRKAITLTYISNPIEADMYKARSKFLVAQQLYMSSCFYYYKPNKIKPYSFVCVSTKDTDKLTY